MIRYDDLTGKKFTRLLVLKLSNKSTKKAKYWLCQCDCGNQVDVAASSLKAKNGNKSCGCLRSEERRKSGKDYSNQKFGMLTIVRRDFSTRKDHNPYWLCKCDCGKETIASINNLKKGEITSCGCFRLEQTRLRAKILNAKKEGDSALNSILYTYKYNADKRDIDFQLTDEQFRELIFSNCGYCGAKPSNKAKNRYGNGDVIYNGIDRIDNITGYEKNNCVACCQNCNRAKYKMSYAEFTAWIKNVYNKCVIENS